MQRNRIRGALAAAAVAVLAGLAPQAAAAQTLAGEQFVSAEHSEAVTYDGVCNPDGSSTFTYYTWGTAAGPFPGQMEETGTFTLASPSGPVTAFSATYTVYGADGEVTGTKELAGSGTGSCSPDGAAFDAEIPATYEVTSPFTESGPASVSVHGIMGSGWFSSDFGAIETGPTSKDDCKDGGYARYGFKNQGECIRAVNHP